MTVTRAALLATLAVAAACATPQAATRTGTRTRTSTRTSTRTGTSTTPAVAAVAPDVAERAAHATRVVIGVAHVRTTRSGHLGNIEVRAALWGPLAPVESFVSAPWTMPAGEAIYFVDASDGNADLPRLLDDGHAIALPLARQAEVVRALAARAAEAEATAPRAARAVATDLALMNAWDQRQADPSVGPAMAAAARVFAAVPLPGLTAAEIEAVIGAPARRAATTWTYSFHSGIAGVVVDLHFTAGRVSAVERVPTQ